MIVVDTTVLVYAVGGDHPLRARCLTLLERVAEGALDATTTPEVIQEFSHVRARRRGRVDAVEQALSFRALFTPLLLVAEDDLLAGLELFRRHERLGAFDSVLAAAAARHGAALVSADRAFSRLPGLLHLDPTSRGFVTSLDDLTTP